MKISLKEYFEAALQRQKEYFETIFRERDLRYQQRFDAQASAIGKAEVAFDRRAELFNELRSGVATTAELGTLEQRITDMKERLDRSEGKGSMVGVVWGGFIAVAGIAVAIAAIWIR